MIHIEIHPKDAVVHRDSFPVMLLEVPDFPPFPGLVSMLVNDACAAVVACRDFPEDNGNGWAFCDLSGDEKTAIGEALVEHEAEYGTWYMATMYKDAD